MHLRKRLQIIFRVIIILFISLSPSLAAAPKAVLASPQGKPFFAPAPAVSIDIPGSLLIGEDFTFTVTFDNTSAVDVGFGPYVDIFLPQSGADDSTSGEKEDGVTYTSVDYLGNEIRSWDGTCADNASFTHPLTGLSVTCPATPAGMVSPFTWQYVIVELPFGSFAPEQPAAPVTVSADMSDYADLSLSLPVYAQGGFRFGADALDNPSTDPAVIGTRVSAVTTPVLFILDKQYLWREDETSTGPNYPRQYLLTVNIPEGQTITNLVITDTLPGNMQFLSVDSTSPAVTGCTIPSTTIPGGVIQCTFASVTGTAADVDASVTFSFYIPLDDVSGSRVIPPETGGCVISENDVSATANWDPLDPRDGLATLTETLDPGHELEDCSHTIQKFIDIQNDVSPDSYSPNDTIEYRHEFQVSDFFAEDDFTVTDTISDGQHFDSTFTPTLSINGNTYVLAEAPIDGINYTVAPDYTPADPAPNTGETVITFRVSDEIITRGQPNGRLVGGCVPTTGTGGADPDCALYNDGATTGIIKYRVNVLEEFTDTYPSGDPSVDQGDQLTNSVIAAAAILNNGDLSSTGNIAVEDSAQSFVIGYGELLKSIYAVNGNTSFTTPVYLSPTETITYNITYSLNTSDIEDLDINDYLPLPVLDADELTAFDDVVSAAVPAAGHVKFGPNDTFRAYSGIVPSITVDSLNNSFELYYGDFDSTLNESKVIDLLFTVTVSDDPFADELYLTNQARVYEGSTNHDESDETSIIRFILHEPLLQITKGAVASDRVDAVFAPNPQAPVVFSTPGSGCPRAGGLINSTGLAATPIDSNIANLDSADLVTFAVVLENTGHSGAYDIRLRDDLPAGIQVPSGGLNLCITNGAGTPLAYSDLGGGILGAGIQLDNTLGGTLKPGQTEADQVVDTGENIAIATFDLELIASVEPADVIINTATLFNYSGAVGGGDFTAEDQTDDAETTVRLPSATKAFITSNYAHTATDELTIGETATYSLTVTFPEGEIPDAGLTDNLPEWLAFVDCVSVSASSGDLTTNLPGGFSAACNDPVNPVVAVDGSQFAFDLGDVTNANSDNTIPENLTFTFTANVINHADNQDGDTLTNSAVFDWAGGAITSTSAVVNIVEPSMIVAKSANPTTGDAGDTVTFTITVSNPAGGIDAFNVTLDDIVPAEITYDAGSFSHTAGLAPDSTTEAPDLYAYWDIFPAGSSSTFQFTGEIKTSVTPGDIIYNDAIVKFTSLPGSPVQQSPYNTLAYERTGDQADPGTTANDYTVTDPASVSIVIPEPIKYLITTSENHTTGQDVAVGEIVRYRISTIIPEGTSEDFYIRDILPDGLLYLDDGTAQFTFVSNGTGISSSTLACTNDSGASGDPADINTALIDCALPASALSNEGTLDAFQRGDDPWFLFGDLLNQDNDADREYVIVEFNALTVNITGNQSGTSLTNDFRVYEGGAQVANARDLTVTIVEPAISINKTVSAGPYDAGDSITYTIVISNSSAANSTAAFDLDFEDFVDPAVTVQSHAITVPGYAAYTDWSAGNSIEFDIDRLNPGDSATITIDALIPNDAPAYLDIPNLAGVDYTSLPDSNGTIGNPTGSNNTGTPGDETGERTGDDGIGGVLNDYAAEDNADITLSQPAIDKRDASPTTYTIGEEVTFPIIVTLPEGTTRDLEVVDNLPTGLDYVNYSLVTAAAASSGLLTEDYSGSALSPTVTAPGGSGVDVTFAFGDVVTTADAGTPAPDNNRFLIYVTARVMDVPQNSGGDVLDNIASVRFTDPNTGGTRSISDTPVSIDLIEPAMQITKTFDPDQAAINETVEIDLVVSNVGTSPAYDVIIEDPYPTAIFASVAEVSTPGDFTFSSATAGGNHTVTYTGGPIEVGGSRTFTISATVGGAFPAGTTYDNTAVVTQATTIDGPNAYERDEPDVSATDTLLAISPDLELDKDDGQATALAGEILIYTITIDNVGLHDAEGIVVTDEVPVAGTFDAVNSSPGWSCADGAPAGTICTFAIASLASSGQTQVFFAVEVDYPALSTTDTIENTASVSDNGVFGVDPTPDNNIDDDIDSMASDPVMEMYKTDALLIDADSSGNPSAGDTLRYTISIENTGDRDAGNVVFTDTPGVNTTLIAGSVSTSQGSITSGNNAGNTSISINMGTIPALGGTATINFNVTIDDPLPADVTFVENQGFINGSNFPEEPSDDPDYPDEDEPTLTLLDGSLMKVVTSTNQGHTAGVDVAIGEIVTYTVTLYIPPGETRLASLTDTLSQGFAFVDCLSTTAGAGLSTDAAGSFGGVCANAAVSEYLPGSLADVDQGRLVTFDLGNLSNATATAVPLTVSYRAVVLDSSGNQDGGQVQNDVIWDFEAGYLVASAPPLDIVEPDLRIVKSADRTSASNGTIITFTLAIDHTASSAADAFNLEMIDALPVNLIYVPGTLTFVSGTPAAVDDTDPLNLRATWVDFPLGGAETILEFQAEVSGLRAGQSTSNTALLAWSSLPGDVTAAQSLYNILSTERFYDPPSLVDIYGDSDSISIRRPAPAPDPTPRPTPTFPATK